MFYYSMLQGRYFVAILPLQSRIFPKKLWYFIKLFIEYFIWVLSLIFKIALNYEFVTWIFL